MSFHLRRMVWLLMCLSFRGIGAGDDVSFRGPSEVRYQLDSSAVQRQVAGAAGPKWVKAWRSGASVPEELGDRVIVGLEDGVSLESLLQGRALTLQRSYGSGIHVLQAADAVAAIDAAVALSAEPGVVLAHPVRRHRASLHAAYASLPRDRYFSRQWHLENAPAGSDVLGIRSDVNARSAWPITRGEGILIANVDDGVDRTHPDLAANYAPEFERNFHTLQSNGSHSTRFQYHGTATAGLHSAEANLLGGSGVAPRARFTSWVIFDSADNIPDEQGTADMFQYKSNSVPVQNHSWGNADFEPLLPGTLEYLAVSNAATLGRQGLGVVMVRSSGNTRTGTTSNPGVGDANLDGYANDPHAITVGSVNKAGHFANYSTPGACLLVAGPGGESGAGSIFTTDPEGVNGRSFSGTMEDPDLADYTAGSLGFYGTSAAAPMVTGVVALILSANPQLSYRDVQHILILASRHTDLADADIRPNGVGLRVSHNTGYGVPDAGVAVRLAQRWVSRPPLLRHSLVYPGQLTIPDDGLRVEVSGLSVPAELASLRATGSDGWHADQPTISVPMTDVGQAANPIAESLTGRAALIQRGPTSLSFRTKLSNVASAGAAFAVVYNNEGTTERIIQRDTDPVPIISVMIGHNDGEALAALVKNHPETRVNLRLQSAVREFVIPNTWSCEHVGVRIKYSHGRMGDLRVTVRSPAGTTSVMHRAGMVKSVVPNEMTYWSTHHFGEGTAGTWTVAVSDEASGVTGTLQLVELILHGVAIEDVDGDGLDDVWERARLGSLAGGASDDPDGDGWNNRAEQWMGSDPLVNETVFAADLSRVQPGRMRLSWPGLTGREYVVERADAAIGPYQFISNVPGNFPESGWFFDASTLNGFFRVTERVSPGR